MKHDPEDIEQTQQFSDDDIEAWFESEDEVSEVAPEDIDVVQRYSDAQLRIVRSNMDLSLHNLKQSLQDASYINLRPTYQRRQRWDAKKRSQLIESLLLNIPIPPIFLFENNYNQYEIMDGRQRLEAIKGFLENNYALRGLEYWPSLDGSRYLDLPKIIQRGLLRRTVSAIVLLAETSRPEDSEIDVRMALFKRLNTGGVKLNPHEVRNALYPSLFNQMLQRITQWDVFRDTWGIPRFTPAEPEAVPRPVQANALYKTMADCELVLRFFAIRETVQEKLSGSLRKLLDRSMKRHQNDSPKVVEALEAEYKQVFGALYSAFEGRPFVLPQTNRPSRPAYDAMMVATALIGVEALGGREETIRSNFVAATEDPEQYEILIGRGNTVDTINERVLLAQRLISQ